VVAVAGLAGAVDVVGTAAGATGPRAGSRGPKGPSTMLEVWKSCWDDVQHCFAEKMSFVVVTLDHGRKAPSGTRGAWWNVLFVA